MKPCEKVLFWFVIIASLMMAVSVITILEQREQITEQEEALHEFDMWLQVTDIRIEDLNDRSDAVKRECIDLL